ncbi:MAG: hypothetical protein R3266_02470 [Gemmatimonadota bacterium]|nr:hypothetical protein [Gemmatimonadota bacterium]
MWGRALVVTALVAAGASPVLAHQGEDLRAALAAAFPEGSDIERRTAFLAEEERASVARLSSTDAGDVPGVITYYVARSDSGPPSFAYFDVHVVRTHREVLLFLVDAEGTLRRAEVVRFAEPPEYLPPDAWLKRFSGLEDLDRISTKRDIPPLTGATLTARAATAAARRVLAIHRLVVAPEWAERPGT